MTEQPTDFFWEASATALTHSDVATGTMMGFPCLLVSGAFLASCDHRPGDLIVKLPKHRVQQLIAAGAGKPLPLRAEAGGTQDALLAPLTGPAAADTLDGHWWAIEVDGTHQRTPTTELTRAALRPA